MKSRSSTNSYFNIKILTSENQSETIRVMDNQNTRRQLFCDKREASQPVSLVNVNATESNAIFFNSNTGSMLVDDNSVNFQYNKKTHTSVADLKEKTRGQFTIIGTIKWLAEAKTVEVRAKGKVVTPVKKTGKRRDFS